MKDRYEANGHTVEIALVTYGVETSWFSIAFSGSGVLGYSSFCSRGKIGSDGTTSVLIPSSATDEPTVLERISSVKCSISDLWNNKDLSHAESTKHLSQKECCLRIQNDMNLKWTVEKANCKFQKKIIQEVQITQQQQ